MSAFNQQLPSMGRRLRDHWRGLWGRGDSRPSPHHEAELAQQLLVDDGAHRDDHAGEGETAACAICQLRVRSWQDWLADLPLAAADPPDHTSGRRHRTVRDTFGCS
jgi:hypothetical protein